MWRIHSAQARLFSSMEANNQPFVLRRCSVPFKKLKGEKSFHIPAEIKTELLETGGQRERCLNNVVSRVWEFTTQMLGIYLRLHSIPRWRKEVVYDSILKLTPGMDWT